MKVKSFFSAAAVALAVVAGAPATALDTPEGNVILAVKGSVPVTNTQASAQFDLSMLRALPSVEIRTSTIWTDGTKTFVGVPLKHLLASVGVTSGSVAATAINDYAVDIPVDSLTDMAPIVAYEMDGAELSVRNKGPLWVIYPYDSDPKFQSEIIYSRSIWQLDRMVAN